MDAVEAALARPALEDAARPFAGSPHTLDIACEPDLRLPADAVAALSDIAARAIRLTVDGAFPDGRTGRVWIRLTHDNGRVKLSVSNDGVGAPDDIPDGFEEIEVRAARLDGFARLGTRLFGGSEIAVTYRAV
jgi:two-component sensor histidine kinase